MTTFDSLSFVGVLVSVPNNLGLNISTARFKTGKIVTTGRWGGDSGVVILGKSDVVINDILIDAVSKELGPLRGTEVG